MDYHYIEYRFTVQPLQPASEILIAELAQVNFDSFVETAEGVEAYILFDEDNESAVKALPIMQNADFQISYVRTDIEPTNWNEEWEKNFSPIEVDGKCYVRATFHEPKPNFEYEIVIDPKMSFGTGHHETTHQMIQNILNFDCKGKKVLDMGCGTGILAMLAKKKGADYVEAIDIDDWAYQNAIENAKRNELDINLKLGDATVLGDTIFDMILANINRNILLEDGKKYIQVLSKGGSLFLSGFYEEDLAVIIKYFESLGLTFQSNTIRNRWVSAWFVK